MARGINRLTPKAVASFKEAGYYCDGLGLYLQVSKSQTKSWLFRFMLNGKAREMGLGPAHTVTLAEARAKADSCRKLLLDGIDPIQARDQRITAERIAASKGQTFDQCAEGYISAQRAGWKNEKHGEQWENTLKTYASPIFGSLPVSAVDTDLVLKVLQPIWATKPETASRVRGRIEKVLDWATTRQYRQGENPARWRGHLDTLLAKPSKVKAVKHHPALPYARMSDFMKAVGDEAGTSARALEFAILTACRSGEVRGAEWSEFDLSERVWTIPKERMKAGREHRVPLSDAAHALISKLPKIKGTTLTFPGAKEGAMLSDMSLTAVIRRMNEDAETKRHAKHKVSDDDKKPLWSDSAGKPITVHGFRSSFRDWAGETTAHPREVIEHALAHQLKDKAEAAYQRGDLFEKRRRLMEDWAAHCAKQTGTDKTPSRGKKQE